MRVSARTLIAAILTILIILTTPTGVDSYHYIFTFRNLDFIFSEPPYTIFGLAITRYLCFPYLYLILSGFGFFPPITPIFIFTFLLVRNILTFLRLSNSPSILVISLILGSLIYSGAASSLAIASILVLILKEHFLSRRSTYAITRYDKVEIIILFCLVFSSVTMLPLSLIFIVYLIRRKSQLLFCLVPVTIFVLCTALILPQLVSSFSVDDHELVRKGAFYSRRQFDQEAFQNRYEGDILLLLGSIGYTSKFPIYIGVSLVLLLASRFRIRRLLAFSQYIFCVVVLSLFVIYNSLVMTASPTLGQKVFNAFSQVYSSSAASNYCLEALFLPHSLTRSMTRLEVQESRYYCYRI